MKNKTIIRKKVIIFLILIVIVFTGVAILRQPDKNDLGAEQLPENVRPVKAVKISSHSTTQQRAFPGVVKAAHETKLAFRVGGPLILFDMNIGQQVKKGEVLARIDPRDYEIKILRLEAAVTEANANLKAMRKGARDEDIALLEANVRSAKARLQEAELQHGRMKALHDQKVTAKASLDSAATALDVTQSGVVSAEKALEKAQHGARDEEIEAVEARINGLQIELRAAKNAYEDTWLKAPYDGYVSQKFVENFETVGPDRPVISFLDFSNAEITVAIPEDIVSRKDGFNKYTCSLAAIPGKRFEAQFKEIGLMTQGAHQSYPLTVKITLPENTKIQPGMAATVFIDILDSATLEAGFSTPINALFYDASGGSYVWKIDSKTMMIQKTKVTAGSLSDDKIMLASGIDEGDLVVSAGARFLREGQKVRIMSLK